MDISNFTIKELEALLQSDDEQNLIPRVSIEAELQKRYEAIFMKISEPSQASATIKEIDDRSVVSIQESAPSLFDDLFGTTEKPDPPVTTSDVFDDLFGTTQKPANPVTTSDEGIEIGIEAVLVLCGVVFVISIFFTTVWWALAISGGIFILCLLIAWIWD